MRGHGAALSHSARTGRGAAAAWRRRPAQLQQMLRQSLAGLMEELRVRYGLTREGAALTSHVLHAAETYLRTRPVQPFTSMSWRAFRAAVLLHVAKLASRPHGQRGAGAVSSPFARVARLSQRGVLPAARTSRRLLVRRGLVRRPGSDRRFTLGAGRGHNGARLFRVPAGQHASGRLANVLGVGPFRAGRIAGVHARLARGLPARRSLRGMHAGASPTGGRRRRGAGGRFALASAKQPAGQSNAAETPRHLARPGPAFRRRSARLDARRGRRVVAGHRRYVRSTRRAERGRRDRALGRIGGDAGLFERVRDLLRKALEQAPQKDDITMVLLRRRIAVVAASLPSPYVDLSSPNEAGDVPV